MSHSAVQLGNHSSQHQNTNYNHPYPLNQYNYGQVHNQGGQFNPAYQNAHPGHHPNSYHPISHGPTGHSTQSQQGYGNAWNAQSHLSKHHSTQDVSAALPPGFTELRPPVDNLYSMYQQQQNLLNDPYFYRNMKFDQAKINDYRSNHRQNIQVPEHVLYSQFKMYAKDGGVIDVENFLKLIQDICKHENRQLPDYYYCLNLMGQYDTNRDGSIDFEEFKNMIHQL